MKNLSFTVGLSFCHSTKIKKKVIWVKAVSKFFVFTGVICISDECESKDENETMAYLTRKKSLSRS